MPNTNIFLKNLNNIVFFTLFTLVPLFTSGLLVYFVYQKNDHLLVFSYVEWGGMFLLLILTMAFAITPTTLVALVSGFYLGWWALAYMLPAYLLAAWLGYATGTMLDKGKLIESFKIIPKLAKQIPKMEKNNFGLVAMSKLSPILPFAVGNLMLAALGSKLRPFLLGCLAGMLPRTVLAIYAGLATQEIMQLEEATGQVWFQWAAALLLALSIGWFIKIFR